MLTDPGCPEKPELRPKLLPAQWEARWHRAASILPSRWVLLPPCSSQYRRKETQRTGVPTLVLLQQQLCEETPRTNSLCLGHQQKPTWGLLLDQTQTTINCDTDPWLSEACWVTAHLTEAWVLFKCCRRPACSAHTKACAFLTSPEEDDSRISYEAKSGLH